MSRADSLKLIDNPLAGMTSSEDELGEDLSETRVPLLRHSVKRHSTPSTEDQQQQSQRRSVTNPIKVTNSGGGGGPSPSQFQHYPSHNPNSKSTGLSPTEESSDPNNATISQSQSFGNPGKCNPATSSSSTSVHHVHPPPPSRIQGGMGSVVVVSDKQGGRATSGYLPPQATTTTGRDLSLVSDSSSVLPPPSSQSSHHHHSGSNSQTSCFQDDGYCIAFTKNPKGTVVDTALVKVSRIAGNPAKNAIAETKIMTTTTTTNLDDPGGGGGGGGGSSSPGDQDGKRGSSLGGGGGSRTDLNMSTSTLHPLEGLGDDPTAVDPDRETWSQGLDFLLSIIGFAVDLANVWRFPYFCYKNGGGAFLIPYFLMLALSAIPVFYMELLLGQSIRQGPISMWKICPLFKGVGYCAVTVSYFVSFYYNTIMCWSLHFTISSFSSPLPWTSCNNSWNTKQCYSPDLREEQEVALLEAEEDYALAYNNETSSWTGMEEGFNESRYAREGINSIKRSLENIRPPNATSPASEYFRNSVLEMGGHDIDNLGSPKLDLLVCLAAIYCLLYVILFRGIRSTGKVVYVTALLPYLVMLILLIRGLMLEGASDGIYYYLVPNMTKLWEIGVWSDAAKQIFFSSGAGFGVHFTYASYNNFHNNCYRDCIVTSCVNCFTSLFSGFVIFTFLGSMAHRQGRPIQDVVNVGPGLVFEVYPEAVGTLPGAHYWSLLFFIMLIMLGIDSAMGGLECVITGISDEFKPFFKKKKHGREWFMFFIVMVSFLIGMINVTRGGMYTFTFLDTYAAGSSLLLSVLFEILAVSWVYGLDQLCKDAEAMLGFAPGLYWRICWKFVSPLLISTIIILDLCTAGELFHEDYRYPDWAQIFGYIFTFIPITLVPIVGFIEFMKYPGDCKTKLSYSITPVSEHAAIKAGGRISRMESSHWSYFR